MPGPRAGLDVPPFGQALPGMLLHACHNAFLLMAAYYQKELAAWGWGLDQSVNVDTASLPKSWLAAATIGTAIGFALVAFATRKRAATDSPAQSG